MSEDDLVFIACLLDDVEQGMMDVIKQNQNSRSKTYDPDSVPIDMWVHDIQAAIAKIGVNL